MVQIPESPLGNLPRTEKEILGRQRPCLPTFPHRRVANWLRCREHLSPFPVLKAARLKPRSPMQMRVRPPERGRWTTGGARPPSTTSSRGCRAAILRARNRLQRDRHPHSHPRHPLHPQRPPTLPRPPPLPPLRPLPPPLPSP